MITDLIRKLYPYSYSVVSDANDDAVDIFQRELPFNVFEVKSGSELNGWIVPNNWRVLHARIECDRKLIHDGAINPLGIGVLSPSFKGTLTREELRSHLFFSEECPEAVPYYWLNLYRPGDKNWAFCVTKSFYENLDDTEYYVDLKTEEFPGSMKVLDYFLPGETTETILLNAHNCHPWQANDDLSGCAVGIEIMRQLMSWEKRKYSYRLVIAPELIGTVHWLHSQDTKAQPIIAAIMLKSVGNASPLKLQHSYLGNAQIDKAIDLVMRSQLGTFESGQFRTIYGNDETVFDSPGYEIPTVSLTRYPFTEYHTDADTPDKISEKSLQETSYIILQTLKALELSLTLRFMHRGLISLSSERYQLYLPAAAPGIDRQEYSDKMGRWNLLMNCLSRELDGQQSAIDLAFKYDLPVLEVCDYISKWKEKKLAMEIVDVV
jgi:aminopeptidase-like protein